jgi:hypothetical protein
MAIVYHGKRTRNSVRKEDKSSPFAIRLYSLSRLETKIHDLNKFRCFLGITAASTGSPVNLSKLGAGAYF